jgi:hypothetical protein
MAMYESLKNRIAALEEEEVTVEEEERRLGMSSPGPGPDYIWVDSGVWMFHH